MAEADNNAANWANNPLRVAECMIKTNSKEQDYFRWKAKALGLLAEVEFGQNNSTEGAQHLTDNVEEFHKLYTLLPNKARMEDLIKSLEHGLRLTERLSHQFLLPIEEWRNDLLKLKKKKSRVEDFITRLMISINNVDVVERMADSLQIDEGEGSLNDRKSRYIKAMPNKDFDYNIWEQINTIL